ncbi:two-component system sensor histidine kinase NtrB [Silvibacterium acidisoli]|uniref:two-component system sensor histidine kinase NtrB n=1 Tax=Acidobacteriaceae bacterium ZG23-2 TaxID=2883246 RepID=UPI00406C6501
MSSLPPGLFPSGPPWMEFAPHFTREEATQFLAAIVESSEDAIIGEGLDGIITSWNAGAERMFGYTRTEAIGQSVSILHSEGDAQELDAILQLIREGKRASHFETKRCRKDGTRIDVSVSVSPVRDENRKIIGGAKIIREITDRKRSEELIRKTEKLAVAGRLAASVAHEINNPLAALTNLLYLLKSESLSERASEFLSMADRELARVAQITTQALGFYQESGPPSASRLSEIIDQALLIHQHRIDAASILVDKQCEEPLSIVCHAGEIKQVFVNLIGNALDAMHGSGFLRIQARLVDTSVESGQIVRIIVTDNGVGIDKDTFERLFDPFNTTKGPTRTGLGLWMCEQIVHRHSGKITVKSHQDGASRGTTVVFDLPV